MNSSPRPPTVNNYLDTQQQFTEVINTKSANFIGRDFVFTAINNFLHRYNRGYFTIIGAPGSGKSAMIANYVKDNPHVIYYNAELEGKNHAEEFLRFVCQQLLDRTPPQTSPQARREENIPLFTGGLRGVLPDNATEGSWFLSLLLQQISENLQLHQPNQKLIIAIDGLNCINRNLQPPGTNIFYLPRYVPQGVYFLLSRRPFLSSNSGLLIEAPVQSLNLADYPEENKQDIQNYIRRNLTPLTPLPYEGRGEQDASNSPSPITEIEEKNLSNSPLLVGEGLGERSIKSWLSTQQINAAEFITNLTNRSENNFMYVSQILAAINNGFYHQYSQLETSLPPELKTYYQQHLQQMLNSTDEDFGGAVLKVLAEKTQPISVTDIADLLKTDEFDVEEILESWFEFLQVETISDVTTYRFDDDNFRKYSAIALVHA
ncbi:ATP-binding protein [Cuspidothrix issatschenkoi LEGE 03284]|uniref:ATP-binding protein n=1 Tax=Cuspidothrix issatschenkoi TaxID=230752 RepID=UPI00187F4528|nr:ATP-binding protein [Cuspidothrix issatschenkoi]MBE9230686.1 ATP-binding protein [Cuspidothrix issatschenkoi LEGE 03284]